VLGKAVEQIKPRFEQLEKKARKIIRTLDFFIRTAALISP
jgi:hypothetical protein